MNMKKLLCLVLALVLCGAMAFAEDDLQSQLDAANERIAELEAQVELYQPYYDAQVIAEFDGGVIFLDEVMEEYEYVANMYSQYYGIDLASYGYDTTMKQSIVEDLVQTAICAQKAAELGLDQLDDETLAGLEASADSDMELYIEDISSQMLESGEYTEDTVREAAIEYLEGVGYTREVILETLIDNYVSEALYNSVTADITITDEDVQNTYDTMVAEAETSYANDSTYTSAYTSGTPVVWNPEGYRSVKHVLVKFDDDQAARYEELNGTIETLETELTAEKTDESRSEDEINADLTAAQADLEALYAELMPTATEIVEKFNNGVDFDALIDEYNEDPGMNDEYVRANGYALTEGSGYDAAFLEASLALEEVGSISEPVCSSFGVHVIYYNSDIVPGAVALDSVRDLVEETALSEKTSAAYNAAVATWVDAAAPTYHYDRL